MITSNITKRLFYATISALALRYGADRCGSSRYVALQTFYVTSFVNGKILALRCVTLRCRLLEIGLYSASAGAQWHLINEWETLDLVNRRAYWRRWVTEMAVRCMHHIICGLILALVIDGTFKYYFLWSFEFLYWRTVDCNLWRLTVCEVKARNILVISVVLVPVTLFKLTSGQRTTIQPRDFISVHAVSVHRHQLCATNFRLN